jgi:hypothetical protein
LLLACKTDGSIVESTTRAIEQHCLRFANSVSRLPELLKFLADATPDVFWRLFMRLWSDFDKTWAHQDELLDLLRRNAQLESPCLFFDKKQAAFYDALPPVVTIYRGCSRAAALGLAWTIDQALAERFARGHRKIPVPDPVIVSAKIHRDAILGVFTERNEAEIVVDPDELADITVNEFDPLST